jgi:hypothetical protein
MWLMTSASAVPLGVISSTGIAGLTLGGGTGYLTRKIWFNGGQSLEAHLVLADGHLQLQR